MALPLALIGLIPGLVNKGLELFDKKFTTESEKKDALREHTREIQIQIEGVWDKEQAHITERHKNDMNSNSWLSMNIRPMTLIYLMGLFTFCFVTDVDASIISLLKDLLMTVFVFYFGARTMDKMADVVTKNMKKKG